MKPYLRCCSSLLGMLAISVTAPHSPASARCMPACQAGRSALVEALLAGLPGA